jgi:general stress protein CsbA
MGESSKVGISASKVVALIGTLILIRDSISYFYTTDVLAILFGVVGLIIAFVIFDSLEIIDLKKLKIPYIWWVLLIIGLLLILIDYLVGMQPGAGWIASYLAGILIIIAAIIEILSQKKEYTASKIVTLVGACYVIYESIMFILGGSIASIALAIVGIIFGIILLLTLFDKVDIKVPYTWWVVLIIGFVIFTWVSPVSGTIIMVGFILILMAF